MITPRFTQVQIMHGAVYRSILFEIAVAHAGAFRFALLSNDVNMPIIHVRSPHAQIFGMEQGDSPKSHGIAARMGGIGRWGYRVLSEIEVIREH